MLILIKKILSEDEMIIKIINPQTGEFKEKLPIEGEQYKAYFESVKPVEEPEFNA